MKRDEERRKFIEMQRQDAIEYQQAPAFGPHRVRSASSK
jgi:hypothetical protein